MNPDYIIKIVIGGAGGVGKTTLLHRYLHGEFLPDTSLTIGIQFHTKELMRNGQKIVLSLWDLGGQDRFRFLQPTYCKGAQAGIVFFDMSFPGTIRQVKEWVDLFRNNTIGNIPIVLGGTKLDCVDKDVIESIYLEARETVEDLGMLCFIPTSSKTGMNVQELISNIIDSVLALSARPKMQAPATN